MEMQVEIYDMLETMENQCFEVTDESKALIEELGLTGQKSLQNEKGERSAYNILSEDQRFACAYLFPSVTELSSYSVGPIPYRVLKEAKVAKEHFKNLYVLHQAPAVVKDPVLIGYNREKYYLDGQIGTKYEGASLIARWGEALEPWEKLYERAKVVALAQSLNAVKALKGEIEQAISLISDGVFPTNKNFNLNSLGTFMPFRA